MWNKLSNNKQLKVFFGGGCIVYLCCCVILLFVFAAIFAPVLTKYTPTEMSLLEQLAPPSASHIFGTDELGRDLFTRILYGARISMVTGVLASLIAAVIGIVLGLLAGFFQGPVSQIIMRITDAQLSIPPLILTMVLASLFSGGILGVSIVVGISMVPTYVRILYGMVLSVRENDYVLAAELIGQKKSKILLKHILPNCFPSLIVVFTMNLGNAIIMEASLSYLGLGITAPTPAWGCMVSEGYKYLRSDPLIAILPGLCVLLVVIAFNIIGDSFRDSLDPRLRGKL